MKKKREENSAAKRLISVLAIKLHKQPGSTIIVGRSSHAGHLLVPQIKKEVSELSDAIRAGPPPMPEEGPETRQTVA